MLIRRTLLAFLLFIAPALSAPAQENSSPTTPLTATARNGILHLRYAATAGLGNRLKKNRFIFALLSTPPSQFVLAGQRVG